mgnify:CR=1 FL=1
MPMVYDLPTADLAAPQAPQFTAPQSQNVAAEQAVKQGEATVGVSNAIVKAAQQYQDEVAEASTRQRINSLNDFTRDALYNSDDAFLKKSGHDAVMSRQIVIDDVRKKSSALLDDISDPLEKTLYTKQAEKYIQQVYQTVDSHALNQAKVWNVTEAKSGVERARSNLYDQWSSYGVKGGLYDQKRIEYMASIKDLARSMGVPENSESYKQLVIDEMTKGHEVIIGAMMSNNMASKAKDYIQNYSSEIDVDRRKVLDSSVAKSSDEQEGTNLAMELKAQLGQKGYDELVDVGFKRLGGGTNTLKSHAFEVFKAQLNAADIARDRTIKDERDKLEAPVRQRMIDLTKDGRFITPSQLGAMPEFVSMRNSTYPEVQKSAERLMDEVTKEWRSEQRFRKSQASGYASGKKEAQRDLWYSLSMDPDRIAGYSKEESIIIAQQLGSYGDDFLRERKKLTSPEALAKVKWSNAQFEGIMADAGITDKSKRAKIKGGMEAYLIGVQKDEERVMNPDQIRRAVAAGMADVDVHERVTVMGNSRLSWTTTTKKKLYEVQNPEAVVIPSGVANMLRNEAKKVGVNNVSDSGLRILYRAYLAEKKQGGK